MTVAHDDSKGRAIRQGPYSLEALSLPQDHLARVLTPGVFDVYQVSQEASGTLGARGAS
jgi:hypothetical protein